MTLTGNSQTVSLFLHLENGMGCTVCTAPSSVVFTFVQMGVHRCAFTHGKTKWAPCFYPPCKPCDRNVTVLSFRVDLDQISLMPVLSGSYILWQYLARRNPAFLYQEVKMSKKYVKVKYFPSVTMR